MVKSSKQNLERQDIERLVNILEDWLALSSQMQDVQEDLSFIFQEISSLKHCSNNELSQNGTNSKIKYVLKVLDKELPRLLKLETKIKDSIVQREIIEALQQKINGDRTSIYEISFKKIQLDRSISISSNRPLTKLQDISEKIINFWEKHYVKLSLVAGISIISSYTLFLHSNNKRIYNSNHQLLSETEVIEQNN